MRKREALLLCSLLLAAGLSVGLAVRVSAAASVALAVREHRALTFDGKNDFVVIPGSPSLVLKNGLTLSVRVASGGGSRGHIFWRGDTRAGRDPYRLYLSSGRMAFTINTNVNGKHTAYTVLSKKPVDGNAHFWTAVYDKDDGVLYLYKNGSLEARTQTFGEIDYDTSQMWNMIGAVDKGTWGNFKGTVDEVRLWSVPMQPQGVRRDIGRSLSGKERGLIACWKFEFPQSQVIHDISLNHNHGVLGASPFPDDSDPKFLGMSTQ